MSIQNKLNNCFQTGGKFILEQSDITDILGQRTELLNNCKSRKNYYISEIKKLDEELARVDELEKTDILPVEIKDEEKILRKKYVDHLVVSYQEEIIIQHVWNEFLKLPYNVKRLLEDLYVKNKYWKEIEEEYGICRQSLSSLRKEGIGILMDNSNKCEHLLKIYREK